MPRDEYGEYHYKYESTSTTCNHISDAKEDDVPITIRKKILIREGEECSSKIVSVSCRYLSRGSSCFVCNNYIKPSYGENFFSSCQFDAELDNSD